jgi:Holliday junction DNA helicase RuvB
MEDRRMTATLRNGTTSMQIDWKMPPFTVIAATTRLSKVPMPLRRRFPNRITLDYYNDDDIVTILTADAEKLGIDATPDAIRELAKRGRGTPGTAINLLLNAVDYAHATGTNLDAEVVDAAMRIQKVDQKGLTEMDSKYLKALHQRFGGNPAGVLAIASVLGLSDNVGTVTDVIEPWLLRLGFIDRTPRGRALTDAGLTHLGLGA